MNLSRLAVYGVAGVVVIAYAAGGSVTEFGGDLNAAAVPSEGQPYINDIEQAGTVCPAITAALIAAQLNQESGFDKDAESNTEAEGIAQFETYNDMVKDGEVNPWDPASAIHGMAKLDCKEYAKWGSVTGALAAYNGGDGVVPDWQNNSQTYGYVTSIEAAVSKYAAPDTTKTTTTTVPFDDVSQRIENGLNVLKGDL